jgi:hypothetical protein
MKRALACFVTALFFAACIGVGSAAAETKIAKSGPHSIQKAQTALPGRLTVTQTVESYVEQYVTPKLGGVSGTIPKLKVLVNVLHGKPDETSELNGCRLSHKDFNNLWDLSGGQSVPAGSPLLAQAMPDRTNHARDVARTLHNKYLSCGERGGVYFAPSASEALLYRPTGGCTLTSRAFVAIARATGIFSDPTDLRYLVTCSAKDYNAGLAAADESAHINGHQFTIVRAGGHWVAFDSSSGMYKIMPASFDPDTPLIGQPNVAVKIGNRLCLFRKIGKDWNDSCGFDSYYELMNIYRSGSPLSSSYAWGPYVAPGE